MNKNQENRNKHFAHALRLAKKALACAEVPVGALILKDGEIVATGYNTKEHKHDIFGHAEITALKKATKRLKTWKLEDCVMISTLEPCVLCAAAIAVARIKECIFLAKDPTVFSQKIRKEIFLQPTTHTKLTFVKVDEAAELLKKFFKRL